MKAKCEEIGDDDNPPDSPRCHLGGRLIQAGLSEFQEGGLDVGISGGACKISGYGPDRLIGGLDPGAVGKNDESSGHALLMYARM